MPDRLADVEAKLQSVVRRLADLEDRVRALEEGRSPALSASGAATGVRAAGTRGSGRPDLAGILSLVGRTLIVFGGAYLLRALTESGTLAHGTGIVIGLAYALMWIGASDRAAAADRRYSALFHGLAGVVIAQPLLIEASVRFAFLKPAASAFALAAVAAIGVYVGWRRRLQGLAAVSALGTMVTSLVLGSMTDQFVPFAWLLIALGVATLWLGYDREWIWLRWPAALAADVVVVGLMARALSAERIERPEVVIGMQLVLFALYLGSVGARTLIRGRRVIPFEVVQTTAALGIGLGGAVAVAHASGEGEWLLGAGSGVLGAACYVLAFAFVSRRQGYGVNFYFYATLALVLTVTGSAVLLPSPALAALYALLAVVTTWLAHRFSRLALALHGGFYCCAAAALSGLLSFARIALVDAPTAPWPAIPAAAWAALGATWACVAVGRCREGSTPSTPPAVTHIPRLLFAILFVVGTGAALVGLLAAPLAGMPPDPGVLATLKTVILATAAIVLALGAQYDRTLELGWLVYPILCVGGFKLLLDDLGHSRPATLFLAFAVYGAALVIAPRLARRTVASGETTAPAVEAAIAPAPDGERVTEEKEKPEAV